MIGSGEVLYHLVYVEDLVKGIILAGNSDAAQGEVFILAGEETPAVRELVRMIAEVLGRPVPKRRIPVWPVMLAATLCWRVCQAIGIEPPLYPRRLDFFTKDRAFDSSKAKEKFGYSPSVNLREGLQKTAAWYKDQGLI
jgi:nucleoside-diphosphate-sugar epimerase